MHCQKVEDLAHIFSNPKIIINKKKSDGTNFFQGIWACVCDPSVTNAIERIRLRGPFSKKTIRTREAVFVLSHFSVWLNSSWRRCSVNAHHLCVLTPLLPRVTAATGVAAPLCPWDVHDESSWFWPEWIFDTSVFFFFLATAKIAPRSGPTWSKANRWAWIVSHLLDCQRPLARSGNLWGELKQPQAASVSRGLSSDLIWPGSSAHWGNQRMMLQDSHFQPVTSPLNPPRPPSSHRPLQDGPK